jgi:hypothetical protein
VLCKVLSREECVLKMYIKGSNNKVELKEVILVRKSNEGLMEI